MKKIVHGHTRRLAGGGRVDSPEYRAFTAMKNRCLNKRQARYRDYGGCGITVCDRWLRGSDGLTGFECFLLDMGSKPSPEHSLDRRENALGYSPENCRWATRVEQARNTRRNRVVNVCGHVFSLAAAIEYFAYAPYSTVSRRLARGWDEEDAVLTPANEAPIPSMEVCF
ncbi:hypothetical protein H9Q09_00810 [Aurantimonas sp. DM33-3]|uniref:hypothetical protein n=1 Tax=Aurantimonas sp. DM33-3 TaxID=2766955 RepID=UPI00165225E2|nr:hypothetical protein [Aurantimonas sp. DM33-3]MBC6714724.1 hypothetical protein [Aurantimonas sp. DM33-3]